MMEGGRISLSSFIGCCTCVAGLPSVILARNGRPGARAVSGGPARPPSVSACMHASVVVIVAAVLIKVRQLVIRLLRVVLRLRCPRDREVAQRAHPHRHAARRQQPVDTVVLPRRARSDGTGQ